MSSNPTPTPCIVSEPTLTSTVDDEVMTDPTPADRKSGLYAPGRGSKLNAIIHTLVCIQQIPGTRQVWCRGAEGLETLRFNPHCSPGIFRPGRMNKIYCARKNRKRKKKKENKNRGFRLFPFFIFLLGPSPRARPLYFFPVPRAGAALKRIRRQFNKVGAPVWSIIAIINVTIMPTENSFWCTRIDGLDSKTFSAAIDAQPFDGHATRSVCKMAYLKKFKNFKVITLSTQH